MSDLDGVDILLVEDSPTDAELCVRALRIGRLAGRISWVRDGAEALDFLFAPDGTPRGRTPKVVLLDLGLPRMGGLEVLRRLKAAPGTRTIPVVVLTSSAEDRDVAESYALGVNSYVRKPVEFEAFATVVRQLGVYWLAVNCPPRGARGP